MSFVKIRSFDEFSPKFLSESFLKKESIMDNNQYREAYTITLDDDVMVHQVVERATKIKTKAFVSGEDLIRQLDDLHPVGVFVDIELSESRTGLDVLPQLRTRHLYILVISSPTELNISRALNSVLTTLFVSL